MACRRKTGHHYRLPTEAEWEYAAMGGHKAQKDEQGNALKQYKYAGSDNLSEAAWHFDKFKGGAKKGFSTQPVGQLKPNELGLYDVSGNVQEWCADVYDADFYQKCADKGVVESPLSNEDDGGSARVVRGPAE